MLKRGRDTEALNLLPPGYIGLIAISLALTAPS